MSLAWRVLIFGAACTCALGGTGDACLLQEMDREDTALSLLQKNAKEVVADKRHVKSVPAQQASNTQQDSGIRAPPVPAPVRAFVGKFASNWEWTLTFNNTSLLVGCILFVIYEFCVHAGCKLDGLFDPEWAAKWQYYSYGLIQFASFGVIVPLSEALSTSLGYNPAWSGVLVTIMPAMEILGIEIGRRLVKPFNQSFLCKWLVFGRLWMCASQGMWVIVLLTSTRHSPSLCFWLLMLSRALLGLGSGMVNTPATYMAVQWTSKERMKNMTSYANMVQRLGMSLGVITSSLCLQVFGMTKQNSTIAQMAALPVCWCMLYSLVMIVIFDVSCTREQPPEDSDNLESVASIARQVSYGSDYGDIGAAKYKPEVTIVVPTTEASLARRSGIVLASIIFNFSGSVQREAIDLSSPMIFGGYGIGVVAIGYLIAAINLSPVAWIAVLTESMKKGGWLDPPYLLMYYSWACLISGLFFFNFGTWWMFFIAECVCFCMTTAAIGISIGIALNAGIPDTIYSKDSFAAYRSQTTAAARFFAGPVARGSIFYFGRDGYAVMFAFVLLVSMYTNVVTKYNFLDKSDGYSEETAQMNGVKRGGI